MLLIVVLEKTLRVPSTAWRSNQSIVKEISPKYSLKGLMLRLKLQYFGHLMRRTDSLERPWCWERLKVGGEGTTEYEMVGWHHRLNEHEFEQSPGVGDGQGTWRAAVHGVTKSWTQLSDGTELRLVPWGLAAFNLSTRCIQVTLLAFFHPAEGMLQWGLNRIYEYVLDLRWQY